MRIPVLYKNKELQIDFRCDLFVEQKTYANEYFKLLPKD